MAIMNDNGLMHGAIYRFRKYNGRHIKARCNISTCGGECWFTDVSGIEVAGNWDYLIKESDSSFINNDIVK